MHRVESGFATENVGFGRVHKFGSLEDFPEGEEREVDGDTDVGGDELVAQEGLEDVEAVKQDDDGEEEEGKIGRVGLEMRPEDQIIPVHPLGFERFVELDVRDGDAGPCEQAGNGGQVLKPLEHLRGTGRATHVGQEGDGCRDQHANVGDTSATGG